MNALEIIRDHGPILVLVALFAITALQIARGRRRAKRRKDTDPKPYDTYDPMAPIPTAAPPADRGVERDATTPAGGEAARDSGAAATGAGLAAAAGGALLMGVAASQMAGADGDAATADAAAGDGDGDGGDGGDAGGDGGSDGGGDGGGGDGGD